MIKAWQEADMPERVLTICITALTVGLVGFTVWFSNWVWSQPRTYPNHTPSNVQYSPIAASHIERCINSHSSVSTGGGQSLGNGINSPVYSSLTIYENAVIECLYSAGFEIKYNGEPVRREVTQP